MRRVLKYLGTGQENNTAESETDKWFSFISRFSHSSGAV